MASAHASSVVMCNASAVSGTSRPALPSMSCSVIALDGDGVSGAVAAVTSSSGIRSSTLLYSGRKGHPSSSFARVKVHRTSDPRRTPSLTSQPRPLCSSHGYVGQYDSVAQGIASVVAWLVPHVTPCLGLLWPGQATGLVPARVARTASSTHPWRVPPHWAYFRSRRTSPP